jgi:anti-sigma regulatory factor (Ser/Thr protein kinase)
VTVGTKNGVVPHDHVVHLYEDDDDLVASVGAYLIDAIRADEVVVAVMTPAHARSLRARMIAAGIDVDAACDSGNMVLLDAAETMVRFTVDDWPDAAGFRDVIGSVIERAGSRGQRVRAFGEMVALLWEAGHVAAAIELETLWNDLAHRLPFSLYCAYPAESVAGDDHKHDLTLVCQLHSALVSAAETTRSFAHLLDAPTAARRFVVDLLETWGLHAVVDDASLLTAELASNAVVHARTEFTVAVSARQGVVRISVSDRSSTLPTSRAASTMAISGRGLGLIAALARRWGTELLGDGKIVWVDLAH